MRALFVNKVGRLRLIWRILIFAFVVRLIWWLVTTDFSQVKTTGAKVKSFFFIKASEAGEPTKEEIPVQSFKQ